jgi:hypothetical protein
MGLADEPEATRSRPETGGVMLRDEEVVYRLRCGLGVGAQPCEGEMGCGGERRGVWGCAWGE